MMKKNLFLLLVLVPFSLLSQEFSRKDSLRGSITKERAWWDLMHYELDVVVDIKKKSISGKNTITYKVLQENTVLHLDLQDPMRIKSITQDGEFLTYKKEFSAYFINLVKPQNKGSVEKIEVVFEGTPPESSNPPWDGGFVWRTDKNKNPFIANANQLIGSSSWFPSKDIPYDEPDKGVRFKVTVPSSLTAVANGRLIEEKDTGGLKSFTWEVVNPINGYGINMNIADYVHFSETYVGEKGELDLDYYVLSYNLKKAKKQFKQVPMMLKAFEYWFGPYPFYEDGFKIVETPYLGMEHQSSVTYGNNYENGYLGGDLSLTGQGLKFDFIIIHESGHEWFANSLTNYDVADMWIHEGFTTYSEVLYLDYHFGTEAGNEYLIGFRDRIMNNSPVTGIYKVNQRGSGDMYPKGAAMIHTLRQIIDDDERFRNLLRDMNKDFYHQTLSSEQLENYIMDKTSLELRGFFDQYLKTTDVPMLQYKIKNGEMSYRFKKTVDNFSIPVKMDIDGKKVWISPAKEWKKQVLPNPDSKVSMDPNFYIDFVKSNK